MRLDLCAACWRHLCQSVNISSTSDCQMTKSTVQCSLSGLSAWINTWLLKLDLHSMHRKLKAVPSQIQYQMPEILIIIRHQILHNDTTAAVGELNIHDQAVSCFKNSVFKEKNKRPLDLSLCSVIESIDHGEQRVYCGRILAARFSLYRTGVCLCSGCSYFWRSAH